GVIKLARLATTCCGTRRVPRGPTGERRSPCHGRRHLARGGGARLSQPPPAIIGRPGPRPEEEDDDDNERGAGDGAGPRGGPPPEARFPLGSRGGAAQEEDEDDDDDGENQRARLSALDARRNNGYNA
ncbi:unnamed protein product, partial [Prorocentrum cordatum]